MAGNLKGMPSAREIKASAKAMKAGKKIERFHSYVSASALRAVESADCQVPRPMPVSFSRWQWESLPSPGGEQGGLIWAWRRMKLKWFIRSGGVLVVVGQARSGKTLLLEKMMPGSIIENVRDNGRVVLDARINVEDVPSGIFAIDEVSYHNRADVLRILDETAESNRGLALVFQWPNMFQKYEIAAYLAKRKVLFLEFVRS